MAQTFTLFSYLPSEMRNKIWHIAANARGSTPGAHFFHVYSYNHKLAVPESDDAVVVSSRARDIVPRSENKKEIMGIPRRVLLYHTVEKSDFFGELYEHTGYAYNADNCRNEALQTLHRDTEAAGGIPNPSMYIVDGGLWTACKESRQVMEERFRHRHFQALQKSLGQRRAQPLAEEVVDMPVTGYFVPGSTSSIWIPDEWTDKPLSTHQPRFFTVFPNRDLFVFPLEEFVEDRVCPSWFQWTDTLTHYQYPRNPTKSLSYEYNSGFRNIAFAWEPAFDYEVLYDSCARVFDRPTPRSDWVFDIFSRSLNCLESEYSQPPYKIWIIDYRIRPKQLALEDMELIERQWPRPVGTRKSG
ncbi:hypothetical protein V8F33_000703 [Rhypophila sp. PSN 637]